MVAVRRGSFAGVGLLQRLTGAGEGVALGVDQVLDLQDQFNIFAAIESLAGSTFVGLEQGKQRLPKAQDIGFEAADAGYIADFEVEAVGDFGRVEGAILGKLHSHGEGEQV
jgi:hypothetical protein